jgi:hypothetical protein
MGVSDDGWMTGVGARRTIAAALLAVLPSLAGCSEDFRAPRTLEECRAAAPGAGAGEAFSVAYDERSRALGEPGVVHICVGPLPGSTISVGAPTGVTVDRTVQAVPDDGGVLPVRVTATGGDDTTLTLTLDGPDGSGARSVRVEVDGDQWSFAQLATARK